MEALEKAIEALKTAKQELEKNGSILTWEILVVNKNTVTDQQSICLLNSLT